MMLLMEVTVDVLERSEGDGRIGSGQHAESVGKRQKRSRVWSRGVSDLGFQPSKGGYYKGRGRSPETRFPAPLRRACL